MSKNTSESPSVTKSRKESRKELKKKEVSRRKFLKISALAGALAVFTGAAYFASKREPVIPSPAVPEAVESDKTLQAITEQEIREIAVDALSDYSRVLEIDLSQKEILSNIEIITNLEQYTELVSRSTTNYTAVDELQRIAFVSEDTEESPKKIYVFSLAIDHMINIPADNPVVERLRADFVKATLVHEFSHFLSIKYASPELFSVVYHQIFQKIFVNQDIVHTNVLGAEVQASMNGLIKSTYQQLEETEAATLGDFVMLNRGQQDVGTYPTGEAMGIVQNQKMLKKVLVDVYGDLKQGLKMLLKHRMTVHGREQFARDIGNFYNYQGEDQLIAGLIVLLTIDRGDEAEFDKVTEK